MAKQPGHVPGDQLHAHNITEGIGIAAPLARVQPKLWHFVALAALAGLPAVLSVWTGGFISNSLAAAPILG